VVVVVVDEVVAGGVAAGAWPGLAAGAVDWAKAEPASESVAAAANIAILVFMVLRSVVSEGPRLAKTNATFRLRFRNSP
jgi:hypothetical protein